MSYNSDPVQDDEPSQEEPMESPDMRPVIVQSANEDPLGENARQPIELSDQPLSAESLEQLFSQPRKRRFKLNEEKAPAGDSGEDVTASDEFLALEAQAAAAQEEFATREAALLAEVENQKDKHLRAVADLHNVRRRAEEELKRVRANAAERLIKEILPLVDDFELAIDAASRTESYDQLISGVTAIYRKFVDVLAKEGVQAIPAVGEPFDSSVHEAVMVEEGSDAPDETVTAQLRAGYTLHGRLIRPALVKVAKS
ncbi:MAG: nucleotide exchange factor GrpE [Capsulimonadaceae bacterium]|nr:nucleotide exchange factor GrpE [Capsulimonadaceae bacterium]